MGDLIQGMARQRLDDGMDMVGHDAPGEELVAFPIKVLQRVCDQVRDVWAIHPGVTGTGVEIGFDLLRVEMLQSLLLELRERPIHLTRATDHLLPLALPLRNDGLRERVGQAEGHGIGCSVAGPMRQVGSVSDEESVGGILLRLVWVWGRYWVWRGHRLEAGATGSARLELVVPGHFLIVMPR